MKRLLLGALLFAATLSTAQATTVSLAPDGAWNVFDVSDLLATSGGTEWIDINDGSALGFTITSATPIVLTVVDAGFGGDSFRVYDNGVLIGTTSAGVNSYPNSIGLDFDAALANANYGTALFELSAGTHVITGELFASALDGAGAVLNSTVGGIRASAVPLPATVWLMLSGLGSLGAVLRRRRVSHGDG